jgi:hypothetical protein
VPDMSAVKVVWLSFDIFYLGRHKLNMQCQESKCGCFRKLEILDADFGKKC